LDQKASGETEQSTQAGKSSDCGALVDQLALRVIQPDPVSIEDVDSNEGRTFMSFLVEMVRAEMLAVTQWHIV
jgi:hypothetical protein